MSVNKFGIILFSSFLIVAMTPFATAQSANQDTQKQAMPQKGVTSQNAEDTQSTGQATERTRSQRTESGKATRVSKEKVRQTQSALKREGFDPGPIDGIMGPMTMTALRNFQSHERLEVTGTITPETENALMVTASAGLGRSRSDVGRQPAYRSDSTVSQAEEIREVQEALQDLEYNPGEVNGRMTAQTRQAIREFQWLNSLPVTGNIDERTKSTIDSQWQGGLESTQLDKTYTSSLEREKPAPAEEQTQSQTQTQRSTTYDTTHGATAHDAATSRSADAKEAQDRDRSASTSEKSSKESNKDATERIAKAVEVLQELTGTPDKRVPNELLERAEAIAVIPNMKKGAFGIGGRYGKGVVSQRLESGRWSAPSFIEIGGGSFGLQIGVTSTDLVLVFTDSNALDLLEEGTDLKLGVDAAAVAGPVGRSAEAGINIKLESAIYAYSRSKGLFAGVALDGAVLDIDNSMNEKVYGDSVEAKQILNGSVATNSTVRPFLNALDKAVPKKRMSQR